ncbi:MAG TPA: DinB family protein [Chthonomonadaceae bacterium]|nr:DinB family protein [Chthonomonadaceae bacterium]
MRSQSGDRRREELRRLFEYNDWANERLTGMLEKVFGKQTDLRRSEDPRVRGIQEAAAHIVAAQSIWLLRWQGESPTALPDTAQWPTPASLQHAFAEERKQFWLYFNSLYREGQVTSLIHYTTTRGKPYTNALWQMMQHVVLHSAYHRGQVTARLLDLGYEDAIVSMDLIEFYRETHTTPLEAK